VKRKLPLQVDASVDAFTGESVNLDVVDIGARIKAARKALGITQDALAALAGARSKSGLQDNEAGKNMPGGQMIGTLVFAGINANWLLTGEGPMLLDNLLSQTTRSDAMPKINKDALAAILEGALRVAPTATPAAIADHCVGVYMKCLEDGLITPDGVGSGNLEDAA
jgi:transcriptional regulator with XRE-family HTH domain